MIIMKMKSIKIVLNNVHKHILKINLVENVF